MKVAIVREVKKEKENKWVKKMKIELIVTKNKIFKIIASYYSKGNEKGKMNKR